MNFSKIQFCFISLFIFSPLFGQEQKAVSLQIVADSLKIMGESSSIHTVEEVKVTNTANLKRVTYKKNRSDGISLTRVEELSTLARDPQKSIYQMTTITNENGIFEFVGKNPKQAINLLFKKTQQKRLDEIYAFGISVPLNPDNFVELNEILHNGEAAYKIIIKLSDDVYEKSKSKMEEEIKATTAEQISEANEIAKDLPGFKKMQAPEASGKTPFVYEYVIGKDTKIVWSTKLLSKSGDMLSEQTFSAITLNLPLDDSLFEVPKKIKIFSVQSFGEYLKLKMAE